MMSSNEIRVKKISLSRLDESSRDQISRFNEDHYGTVYHDPEFNRISADNFGSELSYYLAYKHNELIGICPCHTFKGRFVHISFSNLTSYDLPYGGWVYDHSKISLDKLISQTKVHSNEALHISSNIQLLGGAPYLWEGVRHSTAQTVLIYLRDKSVEDIFEEFAHAQKNKIRKAGKIGVTIKIMGPTEIDVFYQLLTELKEKVGRQVRAREYFRDIFSYYFERGRATCLVAYYNGESVSTLIMLANKSFATIWMGGRKMGIPNNLYQNELMIWEAIKWAKALDCDYFDLCTLDETKHPNLARMKLSFSKARYPYYQYALESPAFRILRRLQETLK